MTPEDIKQLVDFQVNEITESKIYSRLANIQKDTHNSEVLKELSAEELKHYHILKKYTGKSPSPKHWKITLYVLIARFFGLTFGIKLMMIAKHAAIRINSGPCTRLRSRKPVFSP